MSQPFVVRVHSLATLDESLERGVAVEVRRPVLFGRDVGYVVDATKNAGVSVPMLTHDRMTSPSVSKWAGTVWLDEHGRPWVTNKSGVHDLFVRRWPHALPEKLARNIGETQIDPNRRMLTEGWWWVNTGRGASCGWLLVSVEAVRRRSTHTPGATGAFRVPLESEQTLAPEARPVYRLPDDLVDTFVGYFADWFAVPPKLAPRIRTGKEVEDVGDNRRNRILTALKADIHGAQGRRGQLNTNLLIRAIDEGKLTFRAVYERVIDDDRSI